MRAEQGDWARARASHEQATGVFRAFRLPWHLAAATAEWAALRDRAGDVDEAAAAAGAAAAAYDRLGAGERWRSTRRARAAGPVNRCAGPQQRLNGPGPTSTPEGHDEEVGP